MFEGLAEAAVAAQNTGAGTQALPAKPLSDSELAALLKCESIIRHGHETALQVYVGIGRALKRIRDENLYRAKHRTFETYCDQEWGITAHHARNNIRAMDVYVELEARCFHLLPTSESQARPVTELPPAEWGPTWEEVIGTAPAGKVTAKHVRAVVDRRMERLGIIKKVPAKPPTDEPVAEAPAPAPALSMVHVPREEAAVAIPEAFIDVHDLSTREQRVRSLAREAQVKLMELANAIGTGDITASKVAGAIQDLDHLQTHYSRKEDWLDHRTKERRKEGGL